MLQYDLQNKQKEIPNENYPTDTGRCSDIFTS